MPGRVLDVDDLTSVVRAARDGGARVVLTNGVFDLLHVGHLRYLRAARAQGDLLVVGVNADSSVRALKPGRPLVPADERAELVAALDPVDYVVLFEDPTADRLIWTLRPDVYVKGADYSEQTLPEMASVRAVQGRVVFVPLVAGRSTSALLDRVSGVPRDADD